MLDFINFKNYTFETFNYKGLLVKMIKTILKVKPTGVKNVLVIKKFKEAIVQLDNNDSIYLTRQKCYVRSNDNSVIILSFEKLIEFLKNI